MKPRFVNLAELQKRILSAKNDLLVIPYGSAFPADAWDAIQKHLDQGNLLVLGGRPFFIPVYRDSAGWRIGSVQNSYARHAGIEHAYPVPSRTAAYLRWDEEVPFFRKTSIHPDRVFALDGYGARYRGLAFFIDTGGNRISSPVVAEDFVGHAQPPRRRVYLSFDAKADFWDSPAAIELIRQCAMYASFGGVRIWLDVTLLTIGEGEHATGTLDVLRNEGPASVRLDLLFGSKVLESKTLACNSAVHEEIAFTSPLKSPGLYTIRVTLSANGTEVERYSSGIYVRDLSILHSGERLEAGRDYFTLDGKPYLMTGTNYFCTDPVHFYVFCGRQHRRKSVRVGERFCGDGAAGVHGGTHRYLAQSRALFR